MNMTRQAHRVLHKFNTVVSRRNTEAKVYGLQRCGLVLTLLALATVGIVLRAVYLQVFHKDFLQDQGEARHVREISIPARRGMIVDRRGEPLAVSSPVESIWAQPQELLPAINKVSALASILNLDAAKLERKLRRQAQQKREFTYLRRHVDPAVARQVQELSIPGIYLQREYRRYYPDAEVTGHLLGFTNIDDQGQEGMELAYEEQLRGVPGQQRVIKDRLKRVVEGAEVLRAPQPGRDLVLSIDRRMQYNTYRALKTAVTKHQASAASAIIVDVLSGEILALVNQPASNPNSRQRNAKLLRNRAITDVFEPGSTMKPFTVALALESKRFKPNSPIDTRPGRLHFGRQTVRDIRNFGLLDVSRVIAKSSNVGISKIARALPAQMLWQLYRDLGFGAVTNIGLRGEQHGVLNHYQRWSEFVHATHAFGYGLSTTTLQLAQAYTILAADGMKRPLTLERLDAANGQSVAAKRVFSVATARQVRKMMEAVVSIEGTGAKAAIAGYRAAGKTGTVHKVVNGRYAKDQYYSLFAGMAPADQPRLVMVVVVDGPKKQGGYFGGHVAGPVFSKAMGAALRLLNIAPDRVPEQAVLMAVQG